MMINVDLVVGGRHSGRMDEPDAARTLLRTFWSDLSGEPDLAESVAITGPAGVLPSVFDVTGFATAAAGAATLAVAELHAARVGTSLPASGVDRLAASASFRFESLMAPDGWELPPIWDPVAGDYGCADGWVRLHTNYRHHRDRALGVLDAPADRDAVAAAVRTWTADELERAVVAAGGCAAAMRSGSAWDQHPAGVATTAERPVVLGDPVPVPGEGVGGSRWRDRPAPLGGLEAPLAGIRVLDLTRVIAGPVATRYLAAYGAEVLRIDPPEFEEVGALLPEATAAKRCATLDLRRRDDRAIFRRLVAEADVLVGGLRPGALAGLGFGSDVVRALNPGLITVTHDAYGWSGPWSGRRGFDSLVQMSTGIAAAGAAAAGTDRPTPLPAQALDHGVGHLLAAATCRALTRLLTTGKASEVRGCLVGAANVVRTVPVADGASSSVTVADASTEVVDTSWGRLRHAPLAGQIEGLRPRWSIPAGPLGRHEPAFAS
jgi:hypothetical protein